MSKTWLISQEIVSKMYSIYRDTTAGLAETIAPFKTKEEAEQFIKERKLNE